MSLVTKNKIFFHWQIRTIRIRDKEKIKVFLKKIIRQEGKQLNEISIIFCSDKFLYAINKEFLNHRDYTDVITFDYSQSQEISGEIYISLERVLENAAKYGVTLQNEAERIILHGVLHLCGYKDKNKAQKKEMTAKENYYLKNIFSST
jgi:rRNA maturation RNase YbeY